jgi:hypothetical protein
MLTPVIRGLFALVMSMMTTTPASPLSRGPSSHTTMAPISFLTEQELSNNWSGYGVTGGPFTSVGGTFTVTRLVRGTPPPNVMTEWVGIDGAQGTAGAIAGDIIQAGILESMVPCKGVAFDPKSRNYNPQKFHICPWTLFGKHGRYSQGPLPQLTVDVGDLVTVEISQQAPTVWAITMTDNTTRQHWAVQYQYYNGPLVSAEWIVESPGVIGQSCDTGAHGMWGHCPMPAYSPAIVFDGLRLTGTIQTWDEMTVVEDLLYTSTPSPLRLSGSFVSGFSVSYTGRRYDAR